MSRTNCWRHLKISTRTNGLEGVRDVPPPKLFFAGGFAAEASEVAVASLCKYAKLGRGYLEREREGTLNVSAD